MFNMPIDTSAMSFLVGAGAEPIRERGTNRQRTDPETGEPLFAVRLVALIEGRANVITVKVPGQPPALPQGAQVRVHGLLATPWTMEGRSGVAFRAARIEPLGPSARQAPPRAS